MRIKPIGVVHSDVTSTKRIPSRGAPAQVEVFPEFAPGLLGLDSNSHVVIVGWMHRADRQALRLDEVGSDNLRLPKGVFAVRSPSRPNPLGITTARLLNVEGRLLHLERLDMIDGTPIVDIKGYSFGWDSVFGASSFWDYVPPNDRNPQVLLSIVLSQAENFHGKFCRGVVLGTRMVFHTLTAWNVPQRDPDLVFEVGDDGCIADAIQGATGATFGNGRLRYSGGNTFHAKWKERELTFTPLPSAGESTDLLLSEDIGLLFDLHDGVLLSEARVTRSGYKCV